MQQTILTRKKSNGLLRNE